MRLRNASKSSAGSKCAAPSKMSGMEVISNDILEAAKTESKEPVSHIGERCPDSTPAFRGRVRVENPPLAYWLAAISYKIFGVSEWAGRLPFAMILWLTIGLVFIIGGQMFCPRAGFFAAACLAGSYMFLRYGRLAET